MIKQEPNPQFLKQFDLSKQVKNLIEPSTDYQNYFESKQQKNMFDFGLSDEDWSQSNKQSKIKQIKEQKQNINLSNLNKEIDFQSFNKNSQQKQVFVQTKFKLQELYTLSKKKNNKKIKQQTELQQLIKFNQASNSSKIFKKSQIIFQEQDFFTLADKQQQEQIQFSVFNKINKHEQKCLLKSIKNHQISDQKQQIHHIQQKQVHYFQTQNLLKSQFNSSIYSPKVFTMKFLSLKLWVIKFVVHLISIILISIIYGFFSSIILLILHDFLQFFFILTEYLLKHINNNQINIKQQTSLNMSDEIILYNQHQETSKSYLCQQKNFKRLIKFHTSFKYSLYISWISLIGFIIFHSTQVDTFFTVNYFSFWNWSSIITLVIILVFEGICNLKLIKKINEILFYEKTVIDDIKTVNQQKRIQHQQLSFVENE